MEVKFFQVLSTIYAKWTESDSSKCFSPFPDIPCGRLYERRKEKKESWENMKLKKTARHVIAWKVTCRSRYTVLRNETRIFRKVTQLKILVGVSDASTCGRHHSWFLSVRYTSTSKYLYMYMYVDHFQVCSSKRYWQVFHGRFAISDLWNSDHLRINLHQDTIYRLREQRGPQRNARTVRYSF